MAEPITTQFFVARLKPDQVERYVEIHRSMAAAQAEGLRRRFALLDIFRWDDKLVMAVRRRPGALELTSAEIALERQWQGPLSDCFAEAWQLLQPVFRLDEAGR